MGAEPEVADWAIADIPDLGFGGEKQRGDPDAPAFRGHPAPLGFGIKAKLTLKQPTGEARSAAAD